MNTRSGKTRRSCALVRSESGTAMAEMAIVFPFLVLVAIGVADFSRVYYRSLVVTNAARAGAEWGALTPVNAVNTTGIVGIAALEGSEIPSLDVSVASPNPLCKCGGVQQVCKTACATGTEVYVRVIAVDTVPLLIGYPGIGSQVVLRDTATFRQQ